MTTDPTADIIAGPAFTDVLLPSGEVHGLVLVLHGGAERSHRAVDHRSLSWWRGRALARSAAAALRHDGVGVVLLRYSVKGWNAGPAGPSPVPDARWALDQLPTLAGRDDLPVAILGHSMGARTAVAVADHPSVRGVVALAPWLPPDEPTAALTGKVLHAAHGRHDKITSARATRRFVERAAQVADTATYTDMGAVGHYLLRDARRWNAFAAERLTDVLASPPSS